MSSSSLCCAEMALGRLPGFLPKSGPALVLERLSQMPRLVAVTPASRLEVRPAPEMVSIGIRELDSLTGGLPRGCLTEICGPDSSGRTSVLLAALAAATRREEACALVDASDALDPTSAAAVGVGFGRLLWVRCGGADVGSQPLAVSRYPSAFRHQNSPSGFDPPGARPERRSPGSAFPVEQALRVTDLLLQSGGFGMVAVDLGDVPFRIARRIPLTSWFRFQLALLFWLTTEDRRLMTAFACIFVPDFPVQALLRVEPDLRSQAVAVLEGKAPLEKVFAVNEQARRAGIEMGMTKLQVEACPELV